MVIVSRTVRAASNKLSGFGWEQWHHTQTGDLEHDRSYPMALPFPHASLLWRQLLQPTDQSALRNPTVILASSLLAEAKKIS